jgi:LacI family transcriptional regulator
VSPKNLEELARALRVSRRTVSRVLARSPNVAAKERARIEKYLARVKYVPNMAAAHLAAGRTNVLGLVLPTSISQSIDDYVLRLIKGVFLTAEARRHRLMFFSFTPLVEDDLRALFRSRTVGGLLFSFVGEPEFQVLRALRREGCPVALLNTVADELDSFDCDNEAGGHLATRHLLATGRKRIAFVHGDPHWYSSIDRFRGYQRALKEARVPFNHGLIFRGLYDMDTAFRLTPELLRARPDAVFAANDLMALGLAAGFRRAKVRVPKDIALIGFDDIPTVGLPVLETPLSSIHQPVQTIAAAAANRLMDMMAMKSLTKPVHKLFAPELRVRASSVRNP